MSLNPAGAASYRWNYSKPTEDGYSLELIGTIVSAQEVQGREWNQSTGQVGKPQIWPDGNPKMSIRIGLATPEGNFKSFTFSKAGKAQQKGEKPSVHMQLYAFSNGSFSNLIGKTFKFETWPANPETGQPWGLGNPRRFAIDLIPDQKYELNMPIPQEFTIPELYCNDGVSGGQPIPQAPQQIQVPQQMPQPMMQGQYYAAPTQQYQYQQPVQQYPQSVQPSVTQAMPPYQTAQMPQGMDPAVANAMHQVGAMNVQPMYGDEIPF